MIPLCANHATFPFREARLWRAGVSSVGGKRGMPSIDRQNGPGAADTFYRSKTVAEQVSARGDPTREDGWVSAVSDACVLNTPGFGSTPAPSTKQATGEE